MRLIDSVSLLIRGLVGFVSPPLVFVVATMLVSSASIAAVSETQVTSPDGSIQFHVTFNEGIHYEVGLKNKSVIEPSRMVFSVNGTELTTNVTVNGEARTYRINETYPW